MIDKKFIVKKPSWRARKNKTRQDYQPAGNRERVANAQRVREFSQKHKPAKSSDWNAFRSKN